MQIENTEPLHIWVLEYLMDNDYLVGLTRIEAGTKVKPGRALRTRRRRRSNQGDQKLELHYYPQQGRHSFLYNNKRFWLRITRGDLFTTGNDNRA